MMMRVMRQVLLKDGSTSWTYNEMNMPQYFKSVNNYNWYIGNTQLPGSPPHKIKISNVEHPSVYAESTVNITILK